MKIQGLATFNKTNIALPKELQRVVLWHLDDTLSIEYDTDREELRIKNLSLAALKEHKNIVNYCSVKIYEAKDFWNSITGNEEIMSVELEKVLRPIIITNHLKDLKNEIKKAAFAGKTLKGRSFAGFIKIRKLHERWMK